MTFLTPATYQGVIEYLAKRNIEPCYMETCVLYGGQRYKKELHEKTAAAHGFMQLPIVFADGEDGEQFAGVEIDRVNFADGCRPAEMLSG